MKKLSIPLMIALFAFLGFEVSCADNTPQSTNVQKGEVKTAEITFKADKLIEVALLSVQKGKENQFMQEYFSQVMPVALPYGAKPIASFAVTRKVEGTKPVEMVVFFEWESIEQKRAFEQNPKYLELRNLRDDALTFLSQGYFSVEEDVTYQIADNKVYDFAGLFINPAKAQHLQEYFQAVFPEAQKPKFGYTPIATLNAIPGVYDQNYHPSVIAFAEWKGGANAVDEFQKTKVFQQNVAKREAASPYKDVFHLKPIL